jgi:transposase
MWTPENRKLYDRSHLHYPSDVTDGEWELVKHQIPPAKRGGRKREVDEREILNGIMYVLSTGCQWWALPKDLLAKSTVGHHLDLWLYDGALERIHHELYVKCREKAGREASPTAGIVDSQSAKSTEKGRRKLIRIGTMQERKSIVKNSIFL